MQSPSLLISRPFVSRSSRASRQPCRRNLGVGRGCHTVGAIKEEVEKGNFASNPVGLGPYKFVEHVPGSRLVAEGQPVRPPRLAPGRRPAPQAVALPVTEESGGRLIQFTLGPRLTPHVRHRQKYVDVPVGEGPGDDVRGR